jgi:hypothetical protein
MSARLAQLYQLDASCSVCGAENGDHNIDGSCPNETQRRNREALRAHRRGEISQKELQQIRGY